MKFLSNMSTDDKIAHIIIGFILMVMIFGGAAIMVQAFMRIAEVGFCADQTNGLKLMTGAICFFSGLFLTIIGTFGDWVGERRLHMCCGDLITVMKYLAIVIASGCALLITLEIISYKLKKGS